MKFESHPSISLIKNKITNGNNFQFEPMSLSSIELEIRLLNPKKATTHEHIPPKILKSSSEAAVNILHRLFNETITKSVFPDSTKHQFLKKMILSIKKTTDLSAFYRLYLKFMKN